MKNDCGLRCQKATYVCKKNTKFVRRSLSMPDGWVKKNLCQHFTEFYQNRKTTYWRMKVIYEYTISYKTDDTGRQHTAGKTRFLSLHISDTYRVSTSRTLYTKVRLTSHQGCRQGGQTQKGRLNPPTQQESPFILTLTIQQLKASCSPLLFSLKIQKSPQISRRRVAGDSLTSKHT